MDGDDPLGTDHGVMVVQDEPDRLLLPHAAASGNGEEARQCLQRGTDRGLTVTAAFSDYCQSFTAASTAVGPPGRLQAAHCPTVKHIGGHLKKSRFSDRRKRKARGEAQQHEVWLALAKKVWTWRWSLRKQPSNVSGEAQPAMPVLESEEDGFVHRFRRLLRQLVHIFDHAPSAAQAARTLQQLRRDSQALGDQQLAKIAQFCDDHGEQARRYLRKKGLGKHRRGSNSASGMRLLRRLEKNHDGIRSAATRQHDMQI